VFALTWFVLPNLVVFALCRALGHVRALFMFDYALTSSMALVAPRTAAAATAILIALDILAFLLQLFGIDFSMALASVVEIILVNPAFILPRLLVVTALGTAVAVAILLICRPAATRRPAILLVVAVLLVRGIDVMVGGNGPYMRAGSGYQTLDVASTRSREILRALSTKAWNMQSVVITGLTARRVADSVATAKPDIVVIIVESLGWFTTARVRESVFAPLVAAASARNYRVSIDSVPFDGSTTKAELRELCALRMEFVELTPARGQSCLPQRLAQLGYRTDAFHGYSGKLFARWLWYPTVGFERRTFREDLDAPHLRQCGASFVGVCDDAMAAVVGTELARSSLAPRFIYWLTLTGHLPIAYGDTAGTPNPCLPGSTLVTDNGACAHARISSGTVRAIANIVRNQSGQPAVFMVIGDHAPPFLSTATRRHYAASFVPFITLIPNTPGPVTLPGAAVR
jgi:hypothetical protein